MEFWHPCGVRGMGEHGRARSVVTSSAIGQYGHGGACPSPDRLNYALTGAQNSFTHSETCRT